jgi:hypothetical protein
MKIVLLGLMALCAWGADFTTSANFRIQTTPRSAVICYTVPSSDAGTAGTWEISESPSYTPLVYDVDTSLFANSNSDNRAGSASGGRSRCFVAGEGGTGIQYAPTALDGRRYSRAFRPVTTYYARLTVGADTATLSFLTANIASGDSYPVSIPTDPAAPGVSAWPTIDWSNKHTCYNNPQTGVCTQVLAQGSLRNRGTLDVIFHHQYQATGWTNPSNILANDGSLAVTANINPIVVTTNTVDTVEGTLGGMTLYVKGFVADACSAGNDQKISVALTIDGVTAYGPFIDATLPTQTVYGSGVETPVGDADPNPIPFLKAWLYAGQAIPLLQYLSPLTGNYTISGSSLTMNWAGSANPFDQNWMNGSHIILDSSGTPTETTIASVTSGTAVTVASGSGPTTANWIGPNFGFLIRKKTASCSMSIDYVHVLKTHYITPRLNNGSGSNRQAPYRRYPQGWRVTDATNTSPIVLTTGTSTHDIHIGDVVKVAKVLGNTAANGTFTVSAVTGMTVTLSGSTGNGVFSGDGIVWKITPAAATGYVFQAGSGGGGIELFWINPDTTPATTSYVGTQVAYSSGGIFPGLNGLGMDAYALDDSDPDAVSFWFATKPNADPTKVHVYKGTYLGRTAGGLFQDLGLLDPGISDDYRWVDVTPSPHSLSDQVAAFDVRCTGPCLSPTVGSLLNSNTLAFGAGLGGNQNTPAWFGAFDTGTGLVKGLGNSWSAPDSRFCGLHTLNTPFGSQAFYPGYYNLNGDAGLHAGPFRMTVTDTGLNTTSPGDCATILSGLGLSNPTGITGNQCSQVAVNSTTPVSAGTPINETLVAAAIGDYIEIENSMGANVGETVRIVGISGTTILVVQRALWVGATPVASPIGSLLSMSCTSIPMTMLTTHGRYPYYSTQVFWEYGPDPHMLNTADQYQQQLPGATNFIDEIGGESSHNAGRGDWTAIDGLALPTSNYECPLPAMGRGSWVRYGDFRSNKAQCHQYNPAFDGVGGSGNGNAVETHPSAGATTGLLANTHIIDTRPHQDSIGWAETVTKVGGLSFIYKVTGYAESGNVYDYKRQGVTVMSGRRTVRDVSAAGFDYAAHDDSGYSYTYCRAYKTDDCLIGSAVNDVYLNVPKAAQAPIGFPAGSGYRCLGAALPDPDDICVASTPSHGNFIVQYIMDAYHHDGFGLGSRRIAIPFVAPKTLEGSNMNGNELPDGSWEVNDGFLSPVFSLLLFKLPPYPGASAVNRVSWIPVPVKITSVPAGTDNVIVEFGYDPNFFCSSRREVCVANASTIQSGNSVYSYEISDSYSGLSCASGCTVAIPARSQRVMWYQIDYRNASGQTILSRKAEPLVTP